MYEVSVVSAGGHAGGGPGTLLILPARYHEWGLRR